ncbi:Metal-dependent hydrolase, endonuclease/exonuclease/phosphatase family [Actinacidiphila alni]|uniref:Metal-dependent hydrolase, endonuclease/exonuclease/phosphatase family n=1 Tax=Actinacidiphila alni TaxID=380248 RepID=A0A1I2GUP1_9ACTN|nr:endonuclease/exonuclease/phosphatase family protein [Actinacidiphila alni]SFF20883.1 Metal-dependent hydrolase, endonuclease/exonuclease/phosphatase family [Actinacidiphila alni]
MTVEDLPSSATEPGGSAVVRVLSYNIRSMRDDTAALARVIRACAPDLVLIQEAPRFFRWRKAAARLAQESGLVYVTGGATCAGPMILSSLRAHVERTEDLLMPHHPGLHQRGFATAVLRYGGARLAAVSTHLSLSPGERRQQAGLTLDRVAAMGEPYVVLGGDFNEPPERPGFGRIAAVLQDGFATKPWGGEVTNQRPPYQRIDAVFATPGIEVLGCGVPLGLPGISEADLHTATDHMPVLAALRVPAAAPAAEDA